MSKWYLGVIKLILIISLVGFPPAIYVKLTPTMKACTEQVTTLLHNLQSRKQPVAFSLGCQAVK